MFDMHSEINTFHKNHVRLGEEKGTLRDYRDRNISRLKEGLKKLGYNCPIRTPTQGGSAMRTLTQRPENNPDIDHDIDTALIFRREDLPEDPLAARKRVLEGVIEGGGNFRRDPEARTNAVTIWYQENYHVDLAVHRVYTNEWGAEVIEHAGVEWSARDPMDITNWFSDTVNALSPSKDNGATVSKRQMRRIVQWLKYFSKSRPSWKLPGGLIISALVAKCYQPDDHRDDVALYRTIQSIYHRLQSSLEVYNPVDSTQKLTYKDEYINQVSEFRDKCENALDWLAPLFETDCTKDKAAKAWNKVFKHSYWDELSRVEAAKALGERLGQASAAGGVYVGQSGQVSTTKPEGKSVKVPPHRYHGEDR